MKNHNNICKTYTNYLTDWPVMNDIGLRHQNQALTVQNKIIIPIEFLKKSKKLPNCSYLWNFHPNLGQFSGV